MMKLLTAAVTGGLLVTGALTAPAAQAAPAPGIAWGACSDPDLKGAGAQCGKVSVPLDHDRPGGAKITLAVSRIQHKVSAAKYQGVMLVNPGGPGASGLTLATLGSSVPGGGGGAYDWIGFDPRGVGASVPSLACSDKVTAYNRPYYVPVTRSLEETWRQRAKDYSRACGKAGGALLDHLKTVDNVRDMESIRQALQVKQINFYGFSYGTYLGQVYATRYPTAVRRMVLDGVIDVRTVWYESNLKQNADFDRTIGIFFDWVAKHDDVYDLGGSGDAVEKAYYVQLAKLRKTPAGGVIGPDEWTDVLVPASYGVRDWPTIATLLAKLVNAGDSAPAKKFYDDFYPQGAGSDNSYALYAATLCTDVRWPSEWSKWKRDAWRLHAKAPFETWGNTWFNAPCLSWPAKPGKPAAVDGHRAPPILLISETLDAATPFAGALEARRRFPRAALLEGAGGTTHAASLSGVACIDNTVAAYLATGALPSRRSGNRADRVCEPLAPPPASTSSTPAAAGGTARVR